MTSRGRAAGPRSRRFRDPSGGADAVVAPIPRIVSLLRSWASEPFDYLFVIEHHSMRPLHVPYRILVIVATAGMAICSMFLLLGSSGPTGTFGRVWPLAVLVVQVGYIALVAFGPTPTEARTARLVFIGSAVFCDLGLGSVLIQYSPIVSVVACSLLALPSALCVVCVSARWLFAHLVFCVAIISWCAFRVYRAAEFDGWTLVAGVLTTLMAVCLMPAASHLAWNLLSADARSSLRDPLTGLANRRGLRSALRPLWDAALASDDCVGVICIDIDDFKHVNDHLGHDAGDAVLRETADALTLALQPGAVAGRTGGEEFTIVLTGSAADVETMAVDLPAVVSRAGRTTAVTVSVGAVVLHPRAGDDLASRLREALLAADALMYEVKRNGGDATLMRRL